MISILARGMLGNTKISLHKSGHCRLAVTAEAAAFVDPQALPKGDDRAFVKWTRPPAPAEGAHFALSLCFPTDYLRASEPKHSIKKPVLTFEAARPGKAIQLGFFFSREDDATLELKFLRIGKPFCHWSLPNGESVWIVSRETDFDAVVIPNGSAMARSMRVLEPGALPAPGEQLDNLNAILWNSPPERDPLQIIEIGGLMLRHNGQLGK